MTTVNDQELIKQAENSQEWDDVSKLEKQAESDEAKEILHNRKMDLFHKEEYFAGVL